MRLLKIGLIALGFSTTLGVAAHAQDFAAPFEAAMAEESNASQEVEQAELTLKPLWDGADIAQVTPLLGRTQPDNLPLTARSLLVELLAGGNQPDGADEAYLNMRLSLLGQLGALKAVAALSQQGFEGETGPSMAESYIGALLLDDGIGAACDAQSALPTTHKQGAPWARLEAVCFAQADQALQAELAMEIVAEAGTPDPLFEALYAALGTDPAAIDALPPLEGGHAFSTALHLAMVRTIGLDPALLGVTADQTVTRLTLVRAEGAPLATRIYAAEQALMAGQIATGELADLYAAAYAMMHQEGEIDLPDAIQDAALHYNIIQNPEAGLVSGPAIAAAFREAAERGTLPAVAHLYAAAAARQDDSLVTEDDAAIVARGLLSIGAFDAARPWFMVSYEAARNNTPGAFEKMNAAWPLIGMADDATTPSGIQNLAAGWLTTQNAQEDDSARRRAVLLFTLLEGFGRPVAEELWTELLPQENAQPYHIVDHTLWRGMEAAAARGERGMALTLLLSGLSEAPMQDHHPAYLASAVNVLHEIGMTQEGHSLAVEALLAAGF